MSLRLNQRPKRYASTETGAMTQNAAQMVVQPHDEQMPTMAASTPVIADSSDACFSIR